MWKWCRLSLSHLLLHLLCNSILGMMIKAFSDVKGFRMKDKKRRSRRVWTALYGIESAFGEVDSTTGDTSSSKRKKALSWWSQSSHLCSERRLWTTKKVQYMIDGCFSRSLFSELHLVLPNFFLLVSLLHASIARQQRLEDQGNVFFSICGYRFTFRWNPSSPDLIPCFHVCLQWLLETHSRLGIQEGMWEILILEKNGRRCKRSNEADGSSAFPLQLHRFSPHSPSMFFCSTQRRKEEVGYTLAYTRPFMWAWSVFLKFAHFPRFKNTFQEEIFTSSLRRRTRPGLWAVAAFRLDCNYSGFESKL